MSITSNQSGILALGTGDLTVSATLGTTVDQSKSILLVSVDGGSNAVGQAGVRVTLSSDGTTVTATRVATGTALNVRYQVVESALFSVQHFEETLTVNGTNPIAIASVNTSYAFPVITGLTSAGNTRGWDDVYGLEITTTTNVNAEIADTNGGTAVVAFQIVEMSANEISSVNLYKINQSATTVNQAIASVDPAKTLLFGGGVFAGTSGSDILRSNVFPTWELTTGTNLQAISYSAQSKLTSWVYVVEFANMPVNSTRVASAGSSETEVLGAAPGNGGAIINGIMGRYSAANDTDDDSRDNSWSASLSASTWTFSRTNAAAAALSYSTFDWDELPDPSAPQITDVDGGGVVVDGQVGATVSLSGFTGTPTLKLKHGTFESPALSYTGDETGGTFDLPDYAATAIDVAGVPIGQSGTKLLVENGPETAEFDITINPKAGWSITVAVSAGTGLGYFTNDPVADGSVGYYPQTNNQLLHTDFAYESDVTGFTGVLWNSDTGIVEKVTVEASGADTTKPVISLTGSATPSITEGDVWSEPGYTATDNVDGDITGNVVVGGDAVDPNTVGVYVITYNVSDAAGNAATELTRTVTVNAATDTTPPVISLIGSYSPVVLLGSVWVEPGYTATDDVDGDITASVVVGGDAVDTNTLGMYAITYNVPDAAGNNASQVVRTVTVVDEISAGLASQFGMMGMM